VFDGGVYFLKAGQNLETCAKSVSPSGVIGIHVASGEGEVLGSEDVPDLWDPDTDDEGVPVEFETEVADRIGAEREGQFRGSWWIPNCPPRKKWICTI
jgi:hypothetical protein